MKNFFIIILFALCGCGSLQNKISQSHETLGANLTGAASGQIKAQPATPVSVTITGTSNAVPVTISQPPTEQTYSVGVTSVVNSVDDDFSKRRLPLTIALIAGAIGLLLTALAFIVWKRQSASFAAGYRLVDNYISDRLAHVNPTDAVATELHAVRSKIAAHLSKHS